MAVVRVPSPLRPLVAGALDVSVEGATVAQALASLVARHPALAERILVDDVVAPWLNVFVGHVDVRDLAGPATPIAGDDVVTLVPAVAGGA